MECTQCNYTGTEWTIEVSKTYTGTLDSTNTVCVDDPDDYQQETIVKCPECGEWNDNLSAEIEDD